VALIIFSPDDLNFPPLMTFLSNEHPKLFVMANKYLSSKKGKWEGYYTNYHTNQTQIAP
jgi:hypothetical protein